MPVSEVGLFPWVREINTQFSPVSPDFLSFILLNTRSKSTSQARATGTVIALLTVSNYFNIKAFEKSVGLQKPAIRLLFTQVQRLYRYQIAESLNKKVNFAF